MSSDAEPVSIYDWAVTENLQPEPITVEVWRRLPEAFCRQVELVNGQVVRREHPSRAHQAAAARVAAMLDAAAEGDIERNPGTCLDTSGDFDVLLWEVPAWTTPSATTASTAPSPPNRKPASSTSPSGSTSTGPASPTSSAPSQPARPCRYQRKQSGSEDHDLRPEYAVVRMTTFRSRHRDETLGLAPLLPHLRRMASSSTDLGDHG